MMCRAHGMFIAYHKQYKIGAFGEENHNLLIESLRIHHVPAEIIQLITSLYSDYDISILTKYFMTSPIKARRGVLQWDSLLPLLLNLIVNTSLTLSSPKKSNAWDTYIKVVCHQIIGFNLLMISP